ncbi:plasmid stabilization system protein ParE [Sphingopyxis panaciterrae]|uniref:type II toxin-antitoxin system RelE/ParE family toxin n=1 Tax=Sphingopyxis panaciterrae TaxID=363841 RepID=UPI0014226ED5|nr:type II toxin-antitoxin system RelE/ParE family toxin [Sphingopyxis panaciterrae]NIJ38112.1 plasmid stabilization system protein ParE [Sphingopyxis panaciterrae]
MTPVRWTQLSREDLNAFVNRQIETDFEIAEALLEEAARATIFLATSPRAGTPFAPGRRKWRLGKLPFALLYNVDAKRVLILRTVHLQSDWQTLP